MPGITTPELHLLETRDHVDGFQEIKVGGKTSGVITPRNDLKDLQSFSINFSVYIEQDKG